MIPIVQLTKKLNFKDPLTNSVLNTNNMIYCNKDLHEPEEIETTSDRPMQDCLNGDDDDNNKLLNVNISNVSTSFNVKTHLNLRNLALKGHNVEYRRNQGKLMMKLRKPQVTANVWASGKIVCVGSSSEYEAKIASKRIARIIQKLGYHCATFSSYKVINVLGSCTLPFAIKIIPFSEKHKINAHYEPELNPGVTYRIKEYKATLKIFSTGSITVNAPNEEAVQRSIQHIYPLVLPFRREKTLEDDKSPEIIEGMKVQEQHNQNIEVLHDSKTEENFSAYRHPVGGLLNSRQVDTMVQ